jgi:hypothetical protein
MITFKINVNLTISTAISMIFVRKISSDGIAA